MVQTGSISVEAGCEHSHRINIRGKSTIADVGLQSIMHLVGQLSKNFHILRIVIPIRRDVRECHQRFMDCIAIRLVGEVFLPSDSNCFQLSNVDFDDVPNVRHRVQEGFGVDRETVQQDAVGGILVLVIIDHPYKGCLHFVRAGLFIVDASLSVD